MQKKTAVKKFSEEEKKEQNVNTTGEKTEIYAASELLQCWRKSCFVFQGNQ